ncbi:MAG: hypothetical protein ACREGF_02750 [Candidatus Saccharimonadales bacterium]
MAFSQTTGSGKVINQTGDANPPDTMHVKVYSPYQTYFDQVATSISAVNGTGPFDILAGHHKFMSLLSAGEIVIRRTGESDIRLRIARGVMHVGANQVVVFLDV